MTLAQDDSTVQFLHLASGQPARRSVHDLELGDDGLADAFALRRAEEWRGTAPTRATHSRSPIRRRPRGSGHAAARGGHDSGSYLGRPRILACFVRLFHQGRVSTLVYT